MLKQSTKILYNNFILTWNHGLTVAQKLNLKLEHGPFLLEKKNFYRCQPVSCAESLLLWKYYVVQ